MRVGVDAGVDVAASPAAITEAAKILSTGSELEQFFQDFSRNPSDGRRTLDSPMATGTWELTSCSHADVRALATALEVDDVTASVLVRRGLGDEAEARRFLEGALPGHDPFALGDMREAVETIVAAVEAGARICVHGDYDADGICATALAVLLLRELCAERQSVPTSRGISPRGSRRGTA